ncbi:MAG: amidophosphoribosyltransferase [Candidatus Marinimicrobia bacterium]|nr:amidophosphoribosyltransferase [Candidatus Neomarinimicrobiota bacterium]
MCGVVGLISQKPVASELYDSLIYLQHRGQDAAGIITYNRRFHTKKGVGYVRDIFDERNMSRLKGNIGIGHTRYPTTGKYDKEDAQPVWTGVPYGIAMAHNGNLVNHRELLLELSQKDGRHLNTSVDVEVILHVFAGKLEKLRNTDNNGNFFEHVCQAIREVHKRVSGAYSVICMIIGKGMVVFRDPHGIRPLTKGERTSYNGKTDYIFASEPSVFYSLGFESKSDVAPGEVIYISEDGQYHSKILSSKKFTPCIFEYVYFARPDAILDDVSVYRSRLRMGQNLANAWKVKYPNVTPDIIIPAPATSNNAALAMANEMGVRYSEGLYKNPFIGRTFIMPGQQKRKKSIRHKLVPLSFEIKDKDVMIVDDSIVRGNTSQEIVKMVRDFGANKIYFVSACPPLINPCFYGVDIPTRSELIASNMSIEDIREHLDVDILMYQELDDLIEAVTRKGEHEIYRPCAACLDGNYVTGDVKETKINALEKQRIKERNSL